MNGTLRPDGDPFASVRIGALPAIAFVACVVVLVVFAPAPPALTSVRQLISGHGERIASVPPPSRAQVQTSTDSAGTRAPAGAPPSPAAPPASAAGASLPEVQYGPGVTSLDVVDRYGMRLYARLRSAGGVARFAAIARATGTAIGPEVGLAELRQSLRGNLYIAIDPTDAHLPAVVAGWVSLVQHALPDLVEVLAHDASGQLTEALERVRIETASARTSRAAWAVRFDWRGGRIEAVAGDSSSSE